MVGLLSSILILPIIIPIPPLKNVFPPEELAEENSRFVNIDGMNIHYQLFGSGEPVMVLLHGFGASYFSWREVIGPLSEIGQVLVYDRPAFGLTERVIEKESSAKNYYKFDYQDDLLINLLDALEIDQAILIGHSAGGNVSLLTALEYPERVQGLIFIDAAIFTRGGTPNILKLLFSLPQYQRIGPLLARAFIRMGENILFSAWHNPDLITAEIVEGYKKPTRVENWDRAFWEFIQATELMDLSLYLYKINIPVLVISGREDRIVPVEDSIRLAEVINKTELRIIEDCGHIPHEETPVQFLEVVIPFVKNSIMYYGD